ncbi:ORFL216C.iORF1 [Human betaherpesvirus 5]|nr:ORFL216C.iORF1 [Human betaherpesvirus 5]QHX40570.1 ORFL216C.iORF1 [Human betaherpesvirus 5]
MGNARKRVHQIAMLLPIDGEDGRPAVKTTAAIKTQLGSKNHVVFGVGRRR